MREAFVRYGQVTGTTRVPSEKDAEAWEELVVKHGQERVHLGWQVFCESLTNAENIKYPVSLFAKAFPDLEAQIDDRLNERREYEAAWVNAAASIKESQARAEQDAAELRERKRKETELGERQFAEFGDETPVTQKD